MRVLPLGFLAVIAVGTLLLMLPFAHRTGTGASPLTAAFTAVSATCVTGLTVVDTATYWSPFGQLVILGLIQIGGFGVMSMATLLALLVFGRLGMHSTLAAQTESHSSTLGGVRDTLRTIAGATLFIEVTVSLMLTGRYFFGLHQPLHTAAWHGVFHAVSAFNNAGFALYSDNLMSVVADPWFVLPICGAIVAGGLGFPVYYELVRRWRHTTHWSVHAKLTVIGYGALTALSTASFAAAEWANPNTLGGLDTQGKVMGVVLGGITPRTAGFNSIDYAQAQPETILMDTIMMFIGGGSAGTAGGIKVGTFLLLGFVIWAEVRGEPQVVIGRRAISTATMREALSVALLGVAAVVIGTMFLLADSDQPLDHVLFEAASAFGTTGLSTGITSTFNDYGRIVLMVLMFVGRLGPVTAAASLALNQRRRNYRVAEERPLVG
jgi:Trk-type K+ transport system membrane component